MYRVIIQELGDDELAAKGEACVAIFNRASAALARLDRLTERGFDAVAERQEERGWTWVPYRDLALLADED